MTERSVFAAIADARRREIIERFLVLAETEPELSITAIARHVGMDRSTVSRHVAFLRECGVLERRRRGTAWLHSLRASVFEPLEDWVYDTFPAHR
jgi:DNA-binding transcriptional ArsR family regulator